MKLYTFVTKQYIPISLEEAWSFFSNPKNLEILTPEWMYLKGTKQMQRQVYPGMIVDYQIKPLFNIPLHWVTEITQVKELEYFVDEQRFGPYRFWHHEHRFKVVAGGIEMTDILDYALPLGIIGRIVHAITVKKKIKQVFDYRSHKLETLFQQEYFLLNKK